MKIKSIFNKVKFSARKHSPEIMVISGVVGLIGSAVLACRATVKASKVLEDHRKNMESIKDIESNDGIADENTTLSKEDIKKETRNEYIRFGLRLVKLYAVPTILAGVSAASVLFGHNILRKRNISLAAAYAAVDKSFKEYRKNVTERFGEEVDKQLRYNLKPEEKEVTVTDENDKTHTEKKFEYVTDGLGYSQYARFYEEGNNGWDEDPELRLFFLRQQQNHWNDKLRSRGFVFLNEIYEALGIAPTREGQVVGWVYDLKNPKGDNYIDFGIYDVKHSANGRFIEGIENAIILDFNVDGYILDYMN